MLTFFVPPGIGDFSAMYSKLCNIDREIVIRPSNDSPNRIGPFLDILPKIKNGGYAGHGAMHAVEQTLPPGTDLTSLPDGEYFLAINSWLENGGKVADWVPGETDYHYKMQLKSEHHTAAWELQDAIWRVKSKQELTIGVYCSAYGNSRHWGFWGYEEWRRFLEMVVAELPESTQYLFLGAEYDVQIADKLHGWMESVGIQSHLLLGAFHIGATIEVIRALDYFFVFPSGLGFLADVVNTPHLMWFPKHLVPMMGTFCDPENYESGRTKHSVFSEPEPAFEMFKNSGLRFLEDRCLKHQK